MGRALAVSKLSQIKESIKSFETNVQKETKAVMNGLSDMLKKNQPTEVSDAPIKEIEKKSKEVFATLAQINKLESALEIQDEDAELAKTKKNIE